MVNWTHRWFKPGRKLAAAELADSFCAIFVELVERLRGELRFVDPLLTHCR